ncbi:hydrogen gas-evolving membrane-bound hydrogenase subunit E [Candidatus Omnitrophota bacterium]
MTILLVFMIIGAIIALESKDLLSGIICLGAVGFGLCIAFLFLGAPDIAITQLVVEVLCLIILIRATISRDLTATTGDREFFALVVTMVFLMVIFLIGNRVFISLPEFGKPIIEVVKGAPTNTYIAQGLQKTGASNLVSAILLDFRAYDTLGEATVLFVALLGALTILRKKSRKEKEEPYK